MARVGGASTLTNAPVNLLALREAGKAELLSILDSLSGRICMVVDPRLSGPLKLIVTEGSKLLKEHGVGLFQELSWRDLVTECDSILYLVRPSALLMKQIAKQVSSLVSQRQAKDIHVHFVPRRTVKCEKILQDETIGTLGRVYDHCTIGEYNIDLIPFDDDLLSMEIDSSFKECYLEGESSSLFYVARSLLKLQSLFGTIPNIKAKGALSQLVLDMMLRMKDEDTEKSTQSPEIDTLILLDRRVDMVSPMVTPLTFEALMDETMHIENAFVQVDPSVITGKTADESKGEEEGASKRSAKKVALPLNSNDRLFAEIRHMNVTVVGPLLQEKARELQQTYADRHNMQAIAEIKKFVKKIPGMKQALRSLDQFTAFATQLIKITNDSGFVKKWQMERQILEEEGPKEVHEYILSLIARQEGMLQVLRLICLSCLCDGGFKSKVYDLYRRELVQTYGYEMLASLDNLRTLGLLKVKKGSNSWSNMRKHFRLIQDNVNVNEPDDIAYTTAGYAPMSVRIVEEALTKGWRGSFADALALLPGPVREVTQDARVSKSDEAGARMRKTVVVFYVGGVTYLEVAAFRHLSEKLPIDFIIATTKVVNGSTLLQSLINPIDNRLTSARVARTSVASRISAAASLGAASGSGRGAGRGGE